MMAECAQLDFRAFNSSSPTPDRSTRPARAADPRPPGVACPANAKGKLAFTHLAQIHPAAFPWPPLHLPFTTAEPARQTLPGAVRDGSN
jgi:hypothetical protein